MTPRQHGKQDPRLLVAEGPWDFLSAADKDEVLRTTGPWNRISAGLSMGGCLEQPVGFDLVVTLDQRLNEFDELAPESPTEQIAWSIIDDDWPDLDALVSLVPWSMSGLPGISKSWCAAWPDSTDQGWCAPPCSFAGEANRRTRSTPCELPDPATPCATPNSSSSSNRCSPETQLSEY